MNIVQALSYPPILRGFLALILAGCFFPLAGVFILRLNLVTLRFTLMHAALLGAAIGLAFHIDPLLAGLALDLITIAAIGRVARESGLALGYVATFFMVLTIGLAFAVIYKAGVPAKDAFGVLWGSIYSLSLVDLALTTLYALVLVLFVTLLFPRVSAVLFSREIAFASGVNEAALTTVILLFVGVSVALLMKLIGALLLDSILLLPAIIASFTARSTRGFFFQACVIGAFCSIAGFFSSLALDVPASSAVTVIAACLLGAGLLYKRVTRRVS
ncbi:MAG TPA: metal ABC transporter permease [Spirochaetia bacterium]|nr:metal ABC transporter permease [Spirochaetia bacterium]